MSLGPSSYAPDASRPTDTPPAAAPSPDSPPVAWRSPATGIAPPAPPCSSPPSSPPPSSIPAASRGGAGLGQSPPTVELMGRSLHAVTERETIERVMAGLADGRGGWVVTPNLDHVRRWGSDRCFEALIGGADLRVPDGTPLVWASRLQGTPLPERVAGSTLVTTLARAAAEEGRSLYLLGGDPGAAEGAAATLTRRFKTLRIVGVDCPPHGFDKDPDQMARIRKNLSEAHPDIVYVALGSPKQEKVIDALRDVLPHAWWLGVGISLSFLAGQVRRAPRWVQRIGLEWTHRLIQEPRRLARRYLVHGIPFAVHLFGSALVTRVKRRRRGEGQKKKSHTH